MARILIACEESQAVTKEMRAIGLEAYSCDIQECSGGHPEWHIKGNVLEVLGQNWDMVIGFPPCTYLSNAGACWLHRGGKINQERYAKGLLAKEFFLSILNCNCQKVAIENPVSSLIFDMPKHTQEIQPWMFGEAYSKKTRLWLKGLPKLVPTHSKPAEVIPWVSGGSKDHRGLPRKLVGVKNEQKQRSKTFPGVAKAMATQWGFLFGSE